MRWLRSQLNLLRTPQRIVISVYSRIGTSIFMKKQITLKTKCKNFSKDGKKVLEMCTRREAYPRSLSLSIQLKHLCKSESRLAQWHQKKMTPPFFPVHYKQN